MEKIIEMLRSKDKEMIELGMTYLIHNKLSEEQAEKVDSMLHSNDKEMVDLGLTILSQSTSYEEIIMISDKLPHFTVFLMQNIFEDKLEWEIRERYHPWTMNKMVNVPFLKDPTKTLKLVQKV